MARRPRRWRIAIRALLLADCTSGEPTSVSRMPPPSGGWVSTWAKYLPRAEAGDREFQNLLGFMLFFGEGVELDRAQAHGWFHRAADQGHRIAARNLAIMHRLGIGAERDLAEARAYAAVAGMTDLEAIVRSMPTVLHDGSTIPASGDPFRERVMDEGEKTYTRFCAGCHGLNGIAAYIGSPSFALGERLDKPDGALLYSIHRGRGIMPGWGDKLPHSSLRAALDFIRTLPEQYARGIAGGIRRAPSYFFLFGPMERDASAYHGPYTDEDMPPLAGVWNN